MVAFKKRSGLEERVGDLSAVTHELAEFFTPVLDQVHGKGFKGTWIPDRKWVF
jgi:hypothetical protein